MEKQETILNYILQNNPHGVMKVLNENGFTGFLAPQNNEELIDATHYFVEQKGQSAFNKVIKVHPDKDIFSNNFRNIVSHAQAMAENDNNFSNIELLLKENNRLKKTLGLIMFLGLGYLLLKPYKNE